MSHQDEAAAQQILPIVLSRCFQCLRVETSTKNREHRRTPITTSTRLLESLKDAPLDPFELTKNVAKSTYAKKQTVLYLAYGSNLCRETFREKRGIKPLSQVNVVVPQLVMTFDLPGLPYAEPCFANTRYRQVTASEDEIDRAGRTGYHKDAWNKGLVGVAYEVTLADYVHIIATEGGGASYQDVLVDCYVLSDDPSNTVPATPSGTPFKAHTLFAPASKSGRLTRPDPAYAQPSPRYLKLLTDGANEHTLPYDYQDYLHSINGYLITTTKQQLGQFIFLSIWGPLLTFLFVTGRLFADKNGRYPPWLTKLSASIFLGMWTSYDNFFKGLFGDGERTVHTGSSHDFMDEKQSLMIDSAQNM
jgi:hypothetical protein